MTQTDEAQVFEIGAGFSPGNLSGALELGPLAEQYRALFADVLDDGVITAEERERLKRAAANLGMDPDQLAQLERTMIQAYEEHHRVSVVEPWQAVDTQRSPQRDGDAPGALRLEVERLRARVAELEAELREARAHVNVEVDLSALDEVPSDDSLERLRARIARDPANPKHFIALYEACERTSDRDGACRAARALTVLGAAEPAHERLVREHRVEGLITPRRSLALEHWLDELNHPSLSLVTSHIFSLVTPAALVGRAATLHHDGKLPRLEDAARQSVAKSTVTAVRALGWAARVLGMPAPEVVADPEHDAGYAHVPGLPPWSLLGKRVLSGCTPRQHAFQAARHLTYYRAEFFARVLFPDVAELESLFLSALSLGNPSLPFPEHVRARIKPWSEALAPLLQEAQLEELRRQYKAFAAAGGRTNLLSWAESVDKTAARAGLLLCDDLSIAAEILEREEGRRGPLLSDLLEFSASAQYGALRRDLGIHIA